MLGMSLIHMKLASISKQVSTVPKSGINKDDNYRFRSIYDIYNHLQPLFKKEGVFLTPKILESSESLISTNKGKFFRVKLKVEWTLSCEDGSSITAILNGEGIDSSDKASNKAMTASLKYLLIYMFLIPVQYDVDADSQSFKIPAFDNHEEKPKSLLAFAESKGMSRQDLLKLGESLGIDVDKELSSDDRKKLYSAIQNKA